MRWDTAGGTNLVRVNRQGDPTTSGLYLMAADGTGITRLTDGFEQRPKWGP